VACAMRAGETNPSFMNGVPELPILKLVQQKEMYGYELCADAKLVWYPDWVVRKQPRLFPAWSDPI
jgi:hypothetical protein